MTNEDTIDQDAITQTSTTDNKGATYQNVGAVHNAPVIHNTIHQVDETKHQIPKKDVGGLEWYSRLILGWLGDTRAGVTGVILLLFGIGGGSSPFYIDQFPTNLMTPTLLIGIGIGVVGASFLSALQFKNERTCPKCNTEYAVQEVEGATAREIKSSEGPMNEITRPYECSSCGHGFTKTYTVDIEPSG